MTPTIPQPKTLVPLLGTPFDDPDGWADAAAPGVEALITVPPQAITDNGEWVALAEGIERLVVAGAHPLGHISLGFATRPVGDILGEITRWAVLSVLGVFLDHAPAGPFQLGPVVHAVRAARRCGLDTVVVNPGVPVDPIYRRLEATICTFEGSWTEYLTWSGHESAPGDGHLVFDVPRHEWNAARSLIASRRAGLLLVTERPAPHAVPPECNTASVPRRAARNSAPRRPAIPGQNAPRGVAVRQRGPQRTGRPAGLEPSTTC